MGPGQRVIAELSVLEKALSKNDFAAEKGPLEAIVRSLRPMNLKSLDDLDLNTRGRLITTLLRVQRQPKPALPEAGAVAPEAAASTEGAESAAPSEAPAAEGEAAAPTEGATPAEAAPAAPAEDPAKAKHAAWLDVMTLVGRVWRAAGDRERSQAAFTLSGREPTPEPEAPARSEAPRERSERPDRGGPGERRERSDRPPRGDRPERGAAGERRERPPRAERPERAERPPRGERPERAPMPELTGDWKEQAAQLETLGRTRDAARLHERNNGFADATRLFEAGGDLKSALRTALAGQDNDAARRLVGTLPPDQIGPTLEKAGAYELLMEHYVAKADFENVARLYERARQFDQAALAYERANKLTLARKAYERARDLPSANRIRGLEVKGLVERGDRLGAATLLVAVGQRREAVEVLSPLPPPKAFHFMQRLTLEDEAKELAQRELARAEQEQKPAGRARWLELLGDTAAAAETWTQAGRKDKALPLYEKLGDLPRAAQFAEELQQREKAIALYTQLNDSAGLERAKALPEAPATPPPGAAGDKSEAGEDADGADGAATSAENASSAGEQESQ
ncbi:tetratricopeptide repeat protein [Corallococcus sicarius]|uniref:DEAD/DEAH box helicase n=1 Tax=Corallococcus sicarius TaxID=2316726 RepID=A0A3A8NX27_9BACT|nr:DEAD/DEAH box helicase [Corallococcus sicarius]RKH48049.1 DEAD/DEAH box helicase [Corallococcus sicarius]